MKPTKVRVNTAICSKCGEEIYSRAVHDFRKCSCGNIFVDGGFDYQRYGFEMDGKPPKIGVRYVYASKSELYVDWNRGYDKFGVIVRKGA